MTADERLVHLDSEAGTVGISTQPSARPASPSPGRPSATGSHRCRPRGAAQSVVRQTRRIRQESRSAGAPPRCRSRRRTCAGRPARRSAGRGPRRTAPRRSRRRSPRPAGRCRSSRAPAAPRSRPRERHLGARDRDVEGRRQQLLADVALPLVERALEPADAEPLQLAAHLDGGPGRVRALASDEEGHVPGAARPRSASSIATSWRDREAADPELEGREAGPQCRRRRRRARRPSGSTPST